MHFFDQRDDAIGLRPPLAGPHAFEGPAVAVLPNIVVTTTVLVLVRDQDGGFIRDRVGSLEIARCPVKWSAVHREAQPVSHARKRLPESTVVGKLVVCQGMALSKQLVESFWETGRSMKANDIFPIVRIQACAIKRSNDMSTFLERIVLLRSGGLVTSKGFRYAEVDEFDPRWIIKRAKKVVGFDVAVHDA